MVKVQPNEQHCYYLDGFMKKNLDYVKKEVMRKDFDSFLVVVGREGFGKSTIAAQIAMYLDPTYNLDRCTFTADQFEDACIAADKYQAVVFDETMGYLSSRGAMSKFNRRLIKIMSEMRSKNLFVILCIPNFFELDRYAAIHRTTGLIRVYKRGCWELYNYRQKKLLYFKGKKGYIYNTPANMRGMYVKYFPLDKKEYEKKKQESIKTWDIGDNQKKKVTSQRDILIKFAYDNNIATHEKIAQLIGVTRPFVTYIINSKENGK